MPAAQLKEESAGPLPARASPAGLYTPMRTQQPGRRPSQMHGVDSGTDLTHRRVDADPMKSMSMRYKRLQGGREPEVSPL